MFIDTPIHHIFVSTPVVLFGSICASKVTIFEKSDPKNTLKTAEKIPFCPSVWERDSLFFFDGKGADNDQGSLKIKAGQKDDKYYSLTI